MSFKASYLLKFFILMASCLWFSSADATVLYKKIDKDGKVIFTDKPSDDAEAITVQSNRNVIAGPRTNVSNESASKDDPKNPATIKYDVFSIDSPSNGESIQSQDGSINIVVGITPQIRPNHSIRLHINGTRVGQDQKIPYFNLTNIARGSQELTAIVVDDETEGVIQTSKPITFYYSGN
ncbi:MAG TPA: DUF4124 domain-containing protein [Kangiella sp.]